MNGPLNEKTLLISGGSRGIGLAIAVRAAGDGANVCLIAKTAEPDPRLPGTIHTAAAEIEAAGGRALAIVGDVRSEDDVLRGVAACAERFGGIDICINNASAINLAATLELPMKRYDLMQDVNTRGTFLLSKACLPHLKHAENPHVLTLSPPLSLAPKWLAPHVAYTISKFGMSMCTLGMAEEFRADGIAFNSLWPRTLISTAAVHDAAGGGATIARTRRPEIMADAAYVILARSARHCTGNFFIDDEVLAQEGITDLARYSSVAGAELIPDLYVEPLR